MDFKEVVKSDVKLTAEVAEKRWDFEWFIKKQKKYKNSAYLCGLCGEFDCFQLSSLKPIKSHGQNKIGVTQLVKQVANL